MRPLCFRALRATAGLALAAGALGLPASGLAADAPLRTIGVDGAGQLTAAQQPVAISPDGRLVLSNAQGVVLRDVVAGTTTKLLTSAETAVGASQDLSKVLVSTNRAISPKDADADEDYYLYDRASRVTTLVSGDPVTGQLGRAYDVLSLRDPVISADGKVVYFRSANLLFDSGPGGPFDSLYYQWRWAAATGALTALGTWTGATLDWTSFKATDNAGSVLVNSTGITVGAKKLPLPFVVSQDYASAWVSPDGTTVVFEIGTGRGTFTLVNTATGAVSLVTIPAWLKTAGFRVWGAGNAGSGVLLSTQLNRGAGPRTALGFLSKTGALTQVGGDIKTTDASQLSAVTQNLQFAATGLHLVQLGTTALPGVEPSAATTPPSALSYVRAYDVSCSKTIFGSATWTRAGVYTVAEPVGTDLRGVASTDWRVFDTASGRTLNAFTLVGAGKTRDLTVPRTGGWSWTVNVKLTDGTILRGAGKVDPHPVPECTPIFIG